MEASTEQPRRGEIGKQTYEKVQSLIASGKKPTEAFAAVAEQTGRSPATVATAYYRTARSMPGGGGVKQRPRRGTRTRAAAPAARSGGSRRNTEALIKDFLDSANALAQHARGPRGRAAERPARQRGLRPDPEAHRRPAGAPGGRAREGSGPVTARGGTPLQAIAFGPARPTPRAPRCPSSARLNRSHRPAQKSPSSAVSLDPATVERRREDVVLRAADVAIAGTVLAVTAAGDAGHRGLRPGPRRRSGAVPRRASRPGRPAVHDVQVPHAAVGCRGAPGGPVRRVAAGRGAPGDDPRRTLPAAHPARRAATAVERAARRHVDGRPAAAPPPVLRRAVAARRPACGSASPCVPA